MYNGLSQVYCIKPEGIICLVYKGLRGTLSNSEYLDEMLLYAAFHLGPHCLLINVKLHKQKSITI